MKKLLLIPGLACLGIAGYMAIHNTPKWGWFLVAGVLLSAEAFSVLSDGATKD